MFSPSSGSVILALQLRQSGMGCVLAVPGRWRLEFDQTVQVVPAARYNATLAAG